MSVGDGCMPSLVVRRLEVETSIGEVVGVLEDGYRQSTVEGVFGPGGGNHESEFGGVARG